MKICSQKQKNIFFYILRVNIHRKVLQNREKLSHSKGVTKSLDRTFKKQFEMGFKFTNHFLHPKRKKKSFC